MGCLRMGGAYLDSLEDPEEAGAARPSWELEQDIILRDLTERASAMERMLPPAMSHGTLVVSPQVVEAVHREIDALGSTEATTEMAKTGEMCCICMGEYVAGEDLRRLRCGHLFHCQCIKDWVSRASVCPVCKDELQPEKPLKQSISVERGGEPSPEGSPVIVQDETGADNDNTRLEQAAQGQRGLGYLRAYLRQNHLRSTALGDVSANHEGGSDADARRAIAQFHHGAHDN